MATLLALTHGQPLRTLVKDETLTRAGEQSGELYVLERGRLAVLRDGVKIATISEPGSLIGEMSVLLGIDHSATVKAEIDTEIRVIEDAVAFLERSPLVALHVATLACARLNATSALLVELKKQMADKASEQGLLSRIFAAMVITDAKKDRADAHE
jgi:CRP/FNR family transcriptional regulator, cyclic AMP receptor protein